MKNYSLGVVEYGETLGENPKKHFQVACTIGCGTYIQGWIKIPHRGEHLASVGHVGPSANIACANVAPVNRCSTWELPQSRLKSFAKPAIGFK